MARDGQATRSGSGTDAQSRAAVLVRGLHKTVAVGFLRRKVEILKGVDLVVNHNEVFGLLGPNGAGKTTTVKVALGLMRPTSGRCELGVEGLDRVGYLPENPYFYDYLSGREFLGFCARLFGLDAAARHERVEELLRDVSLDRRRGHAPAQVLQGHAAAHRHRPGAHQRPRAGAARRADDRASTPWAASR